MFLKFWASRPSCKLWQAVWEPYQSHPSHVVGVVVALRRVTLTISHQLLVVAWHQVPPLVVLLLVVRVVGGIGVGLVVVVGVAERTHLQRSRSRAMLKWVQGRKTSLWATLRSRLAREEEQRAFPSCQVGNAKISSPFIDRAEIGGTSGEIADFPEIPLRKFAWKSTAKKILVRVYQVAHNLRWLASSVEDAEVETPPWLKKELYKYIISNFVLKHGISLLSHNVSNFVFNHHFIICQGAVICKCCSY